MDLKCCIRQSIFDMNKKEQNTQVTAVRTSDGFIEIVSLNAIDHIVGGLLAPEDAVCFLEPLTAISAPKPNPVSN